MDAALPSDASSATSDQLGRLTRIEDVREVWPHERYGFSAWLLANADYLAELLGIDIELERAEEPVGDFFLDLIGRDTTNGVVLMVENQLEQSDHTHLGQVLLYAAGVEAGTIVWMARRFRDEHRQALIWLNENTGEAFHFFGVEIEAVRIGDSPIAPLLSLVVQPSEWQKRARKQADANRLGGKGAAYVQFWTRFLERAHTEHRGWTRPGRRPGTQSWLDMPSGVKGTYIAASFARGRRLRHELYIDGSDGSNELFGKIESQRDQLNAAYGRPLVYEELPGKAASRVAEYLEDADVAEEGRHDEYIDWFFDAGERLRNALSSAVLS